MRAPQDVPVSTHKHPPIIHCSLNWTPSSIVILYKFCAWQRVQPNWSDSSRQHLDHLCTVLALSANHPVDDGVIRQAVTSKLISIANSQLPKFGVVATADTGPSSPWPRYHYPEYTRLWLLRAWTGGIHVADLQTSTNRIREFEHWVAQDWDSKSIFAQIDKLKKSGLYVIKGGLLLSTASKALSSELHDTKERSDGDLAIEAGRKRDGRDDVSVMSKAVDDRIDQRLLRAGFQPTALSRSWTDPFGLASENCGREQAMPLTVGRSQSLPLVRTDTEDEEQDNILRSQLFHGRAHCLRVLSTSRQRDAWIRGRSSMYRDKQLQNFDSSAGNRAAGLPAGQTEEGGAASDMSGAGDVIEVVGYTNPGHTNQPLFNITLEDNPDGSAAIDDADGTAAQVAKDASDVEVGDATLKSTAGVDETHDHRSGEPGNQQQSAVKLAEEMRTQSHLSAPPAASDVLVGNAMTLPIVEDDGCAGIPLPVLNPKVALLTRQSAMR